MVFAASLWIWEREGRECGANASLTKGLRVAACGRVMLCQPQMEAPLHPTPVSLNLFLPLPSNKPPSKAMGWFFLWLLGKYPASWSEEGWTTQPKRLGLCGAGGREGNQMELYGERQLLGWSWGVSAHPWPNAGSPHTK